MPKKLVGFFCELPSATIAKIKRLAKRQDVAQRVIVEGAVAMTPDIPKRAKLAPKTIATIESGVTHDGRPLVFDKPLRSQLKAPKAAMATKWQMSFLEKNNIPVVPGRMTRAHAEDIIRGIIEKSKRGYKGPGKSGNEIAFTFDKPKRPAPLTTRKARKQA